MPLDFQNKLVISLRISVSLCVATARIQRIFIEDSMGLNQNEKISNHRATISKMEIVQMEGELARYLKVNNQK